VVAGQESLDEICSHFHQVMSEAETDAIQSVEAWVVEVNDPRSLSELLTTLAKRQPLQALQHLRRVKKLHVQGRDLTQVLLGRVDELIEQTALSWAACVEGRLVRVLVAGREPLTGEQRALCAQAWPCLTRVLEPSTPPIRSYPEPLVRAVWAAVKRAQELAVNARERPSAGIMLDGSGHVLAEACDARDEHPLHHAPVLCVHRVAELHRALDRGLSGPADESYLCTGCVLVATEEPCIMCAMALLHSRVRAVVYVDASPSDGALGSRCRLHCHRSLNHHFHCWRFG